MFRGGSLRGGFGGRSKATASTTCQKCLQKDNYECTANAQERPYKPRPSRTQQLLNPQLKPKLMLENPNDLLKQGATGDRKEERGRKTGSEHHAGVRKRSRSLSTDSASTISTNLSRSPSRSPPHHKPNGQKASLRGGQLGKRRRRSVSMDSHTSRSSVERSRSADRNTRRRMSSFSPAKRGRRRSRSDTSRMDVSHSRDARVTEGNHRRSSRSRRQDRSRSRHRSRDRTSKRAAGKQPRSRSPSSPMDTTEDLYPATKLDKKPAPARRLSVSKSRSRSPEPFRRKTRSRSPLKKARSPSPFARRRPRSPSPYRPRSHGNGRGGHVKGRGSRFDTAPAPAPPAARNAGPPPPPAVQKERSLSPYSKRVALTKAMQAGRG
ncbi:hypothetical protein P154DRAFT_578822 [Amniculicola lignicola CBS 123094]|uniref:Uncharacterized protein n=1 Tax=Amniculicola lignicola CBS 123094 TaxID=1392246 RepID=A0A6A5W6Z9_9PLEO|nr:hypothetical protein P154DRAFT_578822 [Amniculicola lignicola CBS 123094]